MSGVEVADQPIPVNVYEGQDFYVPTFEIIVEGQATPANDIMSVTYTDDLEKIDSFEITVNNWDPGAHRNEPKVWRQSGNFKYSDKDTYNPWKDVEVWMGYIRNGQKDLRRMLTGEITTLRPNFPSSGAPTLSVGGLNLFHRFRTKQETRAFFNKTDTEIAQEIVNEIAKQLKKKSARLNLKLDGYGYPDQVRLQHMVMHNQFPIVFLTERARDLGYELIMEEASGGSDRTVTFRFAPTHAVKRKTYVLQWGTTVISFQPTLQTANQVAELTVRGWNPQTKREIKYVAKREQIKGVVSPRDLGIDEPELVKKQEIVVDYPIQDQNEAKSLAENRLRQVGETLIVAKGKTIGLPDLRAGVKIQIKGLGKRFSGPEDKPFAYLVTSTTHSIGDGGYTTDFTARMEQL
jgi:Bacteriophage probable baseplate hub protein